MGVQADRIEAQLRRAVQEVLARGLSDPRVRGIISVTRVGLSPDLADATVYVSVHPADQVTLTMHGLRAAGAHVRAQVARSIALRRVPRITFKLDASRRREADTLRAIRDAVGDDEAEAPIDETRIHEEPES